jgi:hypothetical protein
MGAWGTGVFENDYAMDWVIDLERSDDADFPVSVLRLLGDGGPLDQQDAAVGLAAAEVVAASCGLPGGGGGPGQVCGVCSETGR